MLLIGQSIDALVIAYIVNDLSVRYARLIMVLKNDTLSRLDHVVR